MYTFHVYLGRISLSTFRDAESLQRGNWRLLQINQRSCFFCREVDLASVRSLLVARPRIKTSMTRLAELHVALKGTNKESMDASPGRLGSLRGSGRRRRSSLQNLLQQWKGSAMKGFPVWVWTMNSSHAVRQS